MNNLVADIQRFAEGTLLLANNSVCNVFEEVGSGCVTESPEPNVAGYAKGLLKNSWYVQVNGIDNTVGTIPNVTGADSLSRIKAVITTLPFYGKDGYITVTNSLDYAYRANYLGWPEGEGTNGWVWSGRVPAYGMVEKAITNAKAKYS